MADERDEEREDEPVDPRERDLPESIRKRLEAMVPDMVKRTVSAGIGALFATEENLRKIARDLPGAGDVAGYLATTADSTKDKVLEIIAREVREFLATVNLGEEIAKMLTALSFEVKTEIRFIPNSERYAGVEPDVKAAVRLKRAERKAARRRETTEDDRPPADKPGDESNGQDRSRRRFWRRGSSGEGNGSGGGDPTENE
jgi:hypothetical protein